MIKRALVASIPFAVACAASVFLVRVDFGFFIALVALLCALLISIMILDTWK